MIDLYYFLKTNNGLFIRTPNGLCLSAKSIVPEAFKDTEKVYLASRRIFVPFFEGRFSIEPFVSVHRSFK